MKEKRKKEKGITLIALVITIIVLLILAGVTIATLTGENGILTQANNANIQQSHGTVRDAIGLAYNEYQIEIKTATNTKLASTETVRIPGEEEKSLAPVYSSFMDFLVQKGYVDKDTRIIDVKALTGSSQALGNGENTDVYKIEEENGKYVVNYYDEDNQKEEIWSVSNNETGTETGDITLEPDTGKEALILVYNVEAGDTIEVPYNLKWYSEEGRNTATFDFDVDWGDGNTTNDITNENIESNATHQYSTAGEKTITITGKYEVIANHYPQPVGLEKLIKVEQWGTTGLKEISLTSLDNLTKIASPTENSFKELVEVSFSYSGIQSIPENLFANCPKVTSFSAVFLNTAITSIPENLFANVDWNKVQYISKCFTGCENLTGKAPALWLEGTNSNENAYQGSPDGFACFYNCTELDNYDEIPEYWKSSFVE